MLLTQCDHSVDQRAGHHAFVIIFENNSIERFDLRFQRTDQPVFHAGGDLALHLVIHSQHLLAAGDDPRLYRRGTRRIRDDPFKWEPKIGEDPLQDEARCIVPDDAQHQRRSTEAQNVVPDVRRAAKPRLLVLDLQHRNRRFRRYARYAAERIAVQHQIADNGDPRLRKSGG